ncbi:MAG TPA: DUF4349 domain-containing protein [Gaiellaceae bacterium]|nr:DUF4349 domain-containing protein [Gaiellaceae bacterium]
MSATDMPFERLEALLRGDEPRTLEEKQRSTLLSELRAGALAAPDTLHERVLSTAPVARRRRVAMPSRRLVLVVVPAAAALAVGAALIHGFVNGGSNSNRAAVFGAATLSPSLAAPPVHGSARLSVQKPARTVGKTLSTASSKGDNPTAFQTYKSAAGGNEDALKPLSGVTIPTNRLVHADASMEVQVGSRTALSRATNDATQIVSSLGGYAQNVQYQASSAGYGNAYLALRVPVGKAETAIGRLGALGTLVSQQIQTQDLQHQLTQQNNQIGTLQRAIAVYEQALNSGSLSGASRVEVQIKLDDAEHTLKVLRKSRSNTVASGATADISLTLTTNKGAIVGGGRNKGGVFGRRLGDAAHFLGLEALYVLYALVLLSPFIVIGGLGWGLVRERRRRDEKRLLASA